MVEESIPEEILAMIDPYIALTDSFHVDLITYEGGQLLAGVAFVDDTTLTNKLIAANRHPRMRQIYCDCYDIRYEHGGGMFCTYSFLTPYSKWGSWGLSECVHQDQETAPKWMAHYDCVFELENEFVYKERHDHSLSLRAPGLGPEVGFAKQSPSLHCHSEPKMKESHSSGDCCYVKSQEFF